MWFNLKNNTLREIYQRLMRAGELTDNSEERVCDHHVVALKRAFPK